MQRLKVAAFQFLTLCVLFQARVLGLFLKPGRNNKHRRVAVLEPCPTSVGSNGDEALIEGTCRFLNERSGTTVELLSFYDGYVGRLPAHVKYGGSFYCRGDGNLRKIIRYFSWPLFLARYDELYVIGADLIDGYYASSVSKFLFLLLKLGDCMQVKGSLISCSFNVSPPESILRSARKMLRATRVHARDAYSAERLSTCLGRTVGHSADVAFGLLPESTEAGRQIVDWIKAQQSSGRRVLALNVNLLPITKQYAGRMDEYLRQWGIWLGKMVEQGFSFVLLPHDYRDEWSDEVALVKLFETASPGTRACCFLPRQRLHAPEIKFIVGYCQLVVTGRMHLAIASLGSGVPVIVYAYQSKFEGILRLFEVDGCVRSIQGMFENVDQELSFAIGTVDQNDHLQARVRAHGEKVLALARQNIAPLDTSYA